MIVGILKESEGENRVAITPDTLPTLQKYGVQKILVEAGAGAGAYLSDADYEAKGAQITTREDILKNANLVIKIHPDDVWKALSEKQVFIAQMNPLGNKDLVDALIASKQTTFSMDLIPRTTRAQSMDVLSSMATAAGYKAVLLAATHLPTFFPMFMTAAGTIKPAKVLILGAGVAGLQAIATARRLGAMVEAFDVRAAAKEEVLSLGAKFVEVEGAVDDKNAGGYAVEQSEEFKKRQAQMVQDHAQAADVVICTAQIPGRRAPLLLKKETLEVMKDGAVVVDLAASTGGNCELTENGKTIVRHGVTIIGDSNLPSSIPKDASQMYSKNIANFLKLLIKDGQFNFDWEDDIILGTCLTHEGAVKSGRVKQILNYE
ncbi:MAG: Re/Si-specific NAD(P)(+) transhydrogenase subunit alpha [Bacteroidetes bacterium]|nr:MAG: Re/Si-specific NAD(P)(+) transhydrogenase subunit alpha [Bacteroidota bacterium]